MADAAAILEHVNQSGALQNLSAPVQTALFMGALVFIPAALVCLTGYTRIVIVLSFVRRAVTSQDIPPNLVLIGLSFFLTCFVMAPTFEEISDQAVTPYLDGKIKGAEATRLATDSLKK